MCFQLSVLGVISVQFILASLIDNKLVVFWLNLLLEYLSENTSGRRSNGGTWWREGEKMFANFPAECDKNKINVPVLYWNIVLK